MNKKSIGLQAEKMALEYLKNQGLKFISKNFSSRFGEIDIIMDDGNTHVFVEVRKRKNQSDALESIVFNKQNRLIKTAKYYLSQKGNINCRFDVITIDNENKIYWLQNAITL